MSKKDLYTAIKRDNERKVKDIIDKDLSLLNIQLDNDGRTALYFACRDNRIKVVKILLTYDEININCANKVINVEFSCYNE